MALSLLAIQIAALVSISTTLNVSITIEKGNHLLDENTTSGNSTVEHRNGIKPLLLSTHSSNVSDVETSAFWNLARFSSTSDHQEHFSGSSTILVVTIFVGFTLTGLFLLWRRHRYANRNVICHYTTLDQEVTLSNDLVPENIGDNEFHLDMSDDTASSSDDEELLR